MAKDLHMKLVYTILLIIIQVSVVRPSEQAITISSLTTSNPSVFTNGYEGNFALILSEYQPDQTIKYKP